MDHENWAWQHLRMGRDMVEMGKEIYLCGGPEMDSKKTTTAALTDTRTPCIQFHFQPPISTDKDLATRVRTLSKLALIQPNNFKSRAAPSCRPFIVVETKGYPKYQQLVIIFRFSMHINTCI